MKGSQSKSKPHAARRWRESCSWRVNKNRNDNGRKQQAKGFRREWGKRRNGSQDSCGLGTNDSTTHIGGNSRDGVARSGDATVTASEDEAQFNRTTSACCADALRSFSKNLLFILSFLLFSP